MKIAGMECPNCAMILERLEDKVAGIEMVEASYHKGQMLIEYENGLVTEEQVKNEIKRLGYEVVSVNPSA